LEFNEVVPQATLLTTVVRLGIDSRVLGLTTLRDRSFVFSLGSSRSWFCSASRWTPMTISACNAPDSGDSTPLVRCPDAPLTATMVFAQAVIRSSDVFVWFLVSSGTLCYRRLLRLLYSLLLVFFFFKASAFVCSVNASG